MPNVTAFKLIKRDYKSKTLEKLKDLLTLESPELQTETV